MGKRKASDAVISKKEIVVKKKSCLKKKEKAVSDDEPEGEALIEMLSDDNLAKIFSYLPMKKRLDIEKVSLRWRDVSQQSWHDIKTLDFSNPLGNELFRALKKQSDIEKILERCGFYLTHLNLSSICNSKILSTVRQHCDNLIKIELDLSKYSDTHFIGAFSSMEKLKYIKIANTYGGYLFRCLTSLPQGMEEIHLGVLSSRLCPGYLYNPLPKNSLTKFNSLKCLSINAHELKHNEIKVISQKETLTHLNLAFCKLNKDHICLLSELANLQHLDMRGVDGVFDTFLRSLAWQAKSLKYLDISLCTSITDCGLNELATLESLEDLLVNDMRRNITDYPFEQFRQLKTLDCRNCKYIADTGIIALIRNSEFLERLNVTRTSITPETLVAASFATKIRKNFVILHLVVDSWVIEDFDAGENLSSYLVIEKS